MALIQMGAIVTKIRGKIQGTVFSGNIAGDTIRNKSIPRRSTTVTRSRVNNRWKFLSQRWLQLSVAEKAEWVTYAANFTFYNKLGSPVAARSNLVFNVTNLYQLMASDTIIVNAPSFATPDNVTYDGGVLSVSPPSAEFNWTAQDVDTYIQVFFSPPFQYGKQAIMKKNLKQILPTLILLPGATPQPVDFTTEFFAMFPGAKIGLYTWLAWRRIEVTCKAWSPIEYQLIPLE